MEYSDNYSETSGSLFKNYRDEPALVNGAIVDFPTSNNSAMFNSKKKITSKARADNTKDFEIIVHNSS